MELAELIGDGAGSDLEISGLAHDTRDAGPGTLFFCVRGFTRDGHELAEQALVAGAVALVVDHELGLGVPEVVVPDVRAAMAPLAARFYGDPTARLPVAGITGTNGKTTTAFLVRSLLEAAGRQTGLLGTVTSYVGGAELPTQRTTPEAIVLQRTFAEMAAGGDEACVIEVSSHALELHRADAIHWAVAAFTNLTQDHLDFHPTMEDYFAAKVRLFDAAEPSTALVVNIDDPYGIRLAAGRPNCVTTGFSAAAELRATDVQGDRHGSSFAVGDRRFATNLPGPFNVSNALTAIAVARALGVDDDVIAAALPQAARVPGRFEPVDEGQDFAVIVDYAHTPDSLERVLLAARELTSERVLCVFGCGGDRDRAKRPLMGAAAVGNADLAIVTSDNPRSEDPEAIVAEILAGIADAERTEVVLDRRAAIERAVGLARPGDVVVVAGKGHERVQELAGGVTLPFDDVATAREALRARLDA
ncbi:MAG TPA: UDP-N-acetylmuramoyl-L-alanyl-D-glutamate--2,6-diaminopimelate ligase [Solirubrobacteraceae bacterium]|nr:UDP-N-acetylmuramoyl-L-alanyl-D-glutamate--2,6-diaminopimelate ligase [Solirubrobacteraceae bacterium]